MATATRQSSLKYGLDTHFSASTRKIPEQRAYSHQESIGGDSSNQASNGRHAKPLPTWKALGICAFAGFGGILFGYDTGYINGVMAMPFFENLYLQHTPSLAAPGAPRAAPAWFRLPGKDKSLIVGLLSAGTCVGSILGSDAADYLGRRAAMIIACVVFIWGVVDQTVSVHMDLLGRGRFETGLGMGMVSTVIILYLSEISPAPFRGVMVAFYQLSITLGLLISACVNLGTRDIWNKGSYRIPISLQLVWAVILAVGLIFLPESPRWYVKQGKLDRAQTALARLRCQPEDADSVRAELHDIVASYDHEMSMSPPGTDTYWGSWANCFRGPWKQRGSNVRRTLLAAAVQMFQQISGVNFIFYFGTAFFKQQRFDNVFVIVVVMSAINVGSTIVSFYLVNICRRRTLLMAGSVAMAVCQIAVAVAALIWKGSPRNETPDVRGLAPSERQPAWTFWTTMTGVGVYLFFYATTWGPGAWIITGEIFPLQVRARGVGLATSTNWLWNTIISFLTPVLVDSDHWNLGPTVFLIWGGACLLGCAFTYWFVPETKGLTLEQVDLIFEVSARKSSSWVPPEHMARRYSTCLRKYDSALK
ncbi:general substrate transporter [Bombardia bombarda]|uniref:General substrate transporter n=1 Tax=Bombardia bombarda TaxID=252184 RepID=A0AA39WUV4_9PEZI|nr:general substrate transporter [Bombardia bombarda]